MTIGLEWSHDNSLMGLLTGLEVVTQSDVRSTCRQIEDQVAIVDLAGTVGGALDGVASDIALKAKYNIDLRKGRVTWLAMSLKETRAIGHAAPGFEVTARIRVAINDQPTCHELEDAATQPVCRWKQRAVLRFCNTFRGPAAFVCCMVANGGQWLIAAK